MLSIFNESEFSKTDLMNTERWMRRLSTIEKFIIKREEEFHAKRQQEGYLEDNIIMPSSSYFENDVRAGGGSHLSPTARTIEIMEGGEYAIRLLKSDFEALNMAALNAIEQAANRAGENKAAGIEKALKNYFFKGLRSSEVNLNINTFRKYKKFALEYMTQSLRVLREAGNTVLYQYDIWPPEEPDEN